MSNGEGSLDDKNGFEAWWLNASFDTMGPETVARRAWDAALATRSAEATRFVQCQYAKDVGMPEHSCAKECVYAKREEPK